MARFLKFAFVEEMTFESATQIGLLLAAASTSDAVDGAVIASAATRGDDVLTSDVSDLMRLADAAPRAGLPRPGRIVGVYQLPLRR